MMTDRAEAKTIAKALKFLAAGFDMMATAGVPAVLRTLRTVAGSAEPVCEREKAVTAYCSVEMLQLGSFEARLPHQFLLRSIRSGDNRIVLEGDEAKGSASFGGPPQDGSETYFLSRIEIAYTEPSADRFGLVVDMKLGEPIAHTFCYNSPVDDPDVTYQARFEVAFKDIFEFLTPTTKPHAEAIIDALAERFGLQIDLPPFTVKE
jgi:hypothetical protein